MAVEFERLFKELAIPQTSIVTTDLDQVADIAQQVIEGFLADTFVQVKQLVVFTIRLFSEVNYIAQRVFEVGYSLILLCRSFSEVNKLTILIV